ncbi:MAG: hypothetical protein N2C12_01850, partial [Planctomycetales bacterium]
MANGGPAHANIGFVPHNYEVKDALLWFGVIHCNGVCSINMFDPFVGLVCVLVWLCYSSRLGLTNRVSQSELPFRWQQ